MSRTNLEKETIVLFNQAESTADMTVYDSKLKRRLAVLAEERPDECKLVREFADGSADYIFPKRWVKINPSRILTEEQLEQSRATALERFKHPQ